MDYMKFIREVRSSNLPTSEKTVIIMIASHYDFTKKTPAFPSNKLLAQETGLSVRSVVRAKNTLVELGWLVSDRRFNATNMYVPMVPVSLPYGQERLMGMDTDVQLNTHINTHTNTQLNTNINKKESAKASSLDSISNLNQDDIEISFVDFKQPAAPAASDLIDWFG